MVDSSNFTAPGSGKLMELLELGCDSLFPKGWVENVNNFVEPHGKFPRSARLNTGPVFNGCSLSGITESQRGGINVLRHNQSAEKNLAKAHALGKNSAVHQATKDSCTAMTKAG